MLMDQTYEFEELKICVSVKDNGTDVRPYMVKGTCQYYVQSGWHGSEDEPASSDYIGDIDNIIIDEIYDIETECELCFNLEEDGTCSWFLNRVIKEVDNYLRNNSKAVKQMLSEFDEKKEERALDFALSNIKDF
jgi:hypothetical protein